MPDGVRGGPRDAGIFNLWSVANDLTFIGWALELGSRSVTGCYCGSVHEAIRIGSLLRICDGSKCTR